MKISVRWLNEYLEPGDISPADAERALTFAGFPIESHTPVGNDTCIDVEVTSNRGDVLSHIGVAREIAASTGRGLRVPVAGKTFGWFNEADLAAPASGSGTDVGSVLSIDNRVSEPDAAGVIPCPAFTGRVIRDVKVGPSPKWLVAALEAIGLRSINNVVDITNFVAMEYGQPSHVFDLASLAKSADGVAKLIIRQASKGEKLALLDGKVITLGGGEIVVADEADGGRAISLAGVMGGSTTGVTEKTTDVVLEVATWDPVIVRKAARRFGIRTDSSYRYERIVDARTMETPARRLAALICKLAGGKLMPGVIHTGRPPAPLSSVLLRPARCRSIIGLDVPPAKMQSVLEALEVQVKPEAGHGNEPALRCTIPAHRPDLEREIDLIEEVARLVGLDKLPEHERVASRVAGAQPSEQAAGAIARVLTGLGFHETVTFTFVKPALAKLFLPSGRALLQVTDDRRSEDPVLRPSALVSLLSCRRANQDRGVNASSAGIGDAGVRLYEISSVFVETPSDKKGERGKEEERVTLSLVCDAALPVGGKAIEQKQAAIRIVRGAIDSIAAALGGSAARVEVVALAAAPIGAFDATACAEVRINGARVGIMGVASAQAQSAFGLDAPVVIAELDLAPLVALYPPKASVTALPAFPAIERDLSLIVREDTAWSKIDALVGTAKLERLEAWSFVTTYRGTQIGQGRKSVTLRMRFRDAARTLTHEEVSPQVDALVALAKSQLGAELRV